MTYDFQIEQRLIGAMLMHARICDECLDRMTATDFYRPAHQVLFDAFKEIRKRGMAPEPMTLNSYLDATGKLQDIGGVQYIAAVLDRLGNVNAYPTWMEAVLEFSRLRTLLANIEAAREGVESGLSSSEIAATLGKQCEGVGGSVGGIVEAGLVPEPKDEFGLSTGISLIDKETSTRGAPRGQMCVVTASEGVGKSTLMVQLAVHSAWERRGVLYTTLADLNAERLRPRILRARCGFSRASTAEEFHRLPQFKEAEYDLRKMVSFGIDDRTKRGSTDIDDILGSIEARRRQMMGTEIPLQEAYLDYFQKITSRHFKPGDVYGVSGYASSRISRYAETTGLTIWVGSQITEGNEKQGTRDITKNGRHLLEDAGLAVKVSMGEEDKRQFSLIKSRFGGQFVKAEMYFCPNTLTFKERGQ